MKKYLKRNKCSIGSFFIDERQIPRPFVKSGCMMGTGSDHEAQQTDKYVSVHNFHD